MDNENWALTWAKDRLVFDHTVKEVLITTAHALPGVNNQDVRLDIYDACAQRIRCIIMEKAGVDIAEYL